MSTYNWGELTTYDSWDEPTSNTIGCPVLHIMTFFIFSLPITDQPLHSMEQAVVVSSLSSQEMIKW